MTKLNPIPPVKIPLALQQDKEVLGFFNQLTKSLYQLWYANGGQQGGVIPEDRIPSGLGEDDETLIAPTILTADDRNTAYDNTGATAQVPVTLPPGAQGLKFKFIVTDADGFQIIADGTDVFRNGTAVSSAGGSISSTKIGSVVSLYGFSGGYTVVHAMGIWITA